MLDLVAKMSSTWAGQRHVHLHRELALSPVSFGKTVCFPQRISGVSSSNIEAHIPIVVEVYRNRQKHLKIFSDFHILTNTWSPMLLRSPNLRSRFSSVAISTYVCSGEKFRLSSRGCTGILSVHVARSKFHELHIKHINTLHIQHIKVTKV